MNSIFQCNTLVLQSKWALIYEELGTVRPDGGNEGGRGATPTSTTISIFDSYDIETL